MFQNNSQYLNQLKTDIKYITTKYRKYRKLVFKYQDRKDDDYDMIRELPGYYYLKNDFISNPRIPQKYIKECEDPEDERVEEFKLLCESYKANFNLATKYRKLMFEEQITLSEKISKFEDFIQKINEINSVPIIENYYLNAKYNPHTEIGKKYVNSLYDENF